MIRQAFVCLFIVQTSYTMFNVAINIVNIVHFILEMGLAVFFFFFCGYPHLFVNISYLPYFLFENIRQYVTD